MLKKILKMDKKSAKLYYKLVLNFFAKYNIVNIIVFQRHVFKWEDIKCLISV